MRSLVRSSFSIVTALVISVCFSATYKALAQDMRNVPATVSPFRLAAPIDSIAEGEKPGVIEGLVPGPDSERREYIVVVQRPGWKQQVQTDKDGRFRLEVQPGVYTAFAKPRFGQSERRAKYAPFRVGAGEVKKIEVDPTSEYVYCTASGERVIPVQETYSGNNKRGLRRLEYDSFSKKDGLRVVIEYCGKSYANQQNKYKSVVVSYDGFRIISDSAVFDLRSRRIESSGRVGVVEHGDRVVRSKVTADFGEKQVVLNLTGGSIPPIRGEGSVKSGDVTFDFKINENGISRFNYEDFAKGLKLKSGKHHSCLIVVNVSKEAITFRGSASLTYTLQHSRESIVNFTVALQDLGGKPNAADRFSISIPTENYSRTSAGEIKVGAIPKPISQSVVGIYPRAGVRPR